jgi:uncharacterized protein (DUF1810 family)
MSDPFSLSRFELAQDDAGTYEQALAELRAGRKRSHWMWFVFPQLVGLGHSEMSRRYAISSLQEARAYLEHPVLGERLLASAAVLNALEGRNAEEIFGPIDAVKLRSSMTLFALAAPEQAAFAQVLRAYFAGERDAATERLLTQGGGSSGRVAR